MWKVGPGAKLLFALLTLVIAIGALDLASGGRVRAQLRAHFPLAPAAPLTIFDFPAGAAMPAGDLASMPDQPVRVAVTPRGGIASLLVAGSGLGYHADSPASRAFRVDLETSLLADEQALVAAFLRGGDDGGADAIVLTVDRLAALAGVLREARPKALLLVSRSQGYEALTAAGLDQVPLLRGKRIAVDASSPAHFFLLWRLTQARLEPSAVELLPVESSNEAARLLRESQVDAAAGELPALAAAARERGGRAIASTADAPHLLASVLVARGDFLIRYPDAARRLARAVLEQAELLRVNPLEGARQLSTHVKEVGDPFEALRLDPPSTFAENLAFFGMRGDIPVGFVELYGSASAVWSKLGEPADEPDAPAPMELAPLEAALANPPHLPPKQPSRPPEALKPPENSKPGAGAELLDQSLDAAQAADGAEPTSPP